MLRIPFLIFQFFRAVFSFVVEFVRYELFEFLYFRRKVSNLSDKFVILCHEQAIGPLVRNADLAIRYCRLNHLVLHRDVLFLTSGETVNPYFLKMLAKYAPIYTDVRLHKAVKARKYRGLLNKRSIFNDSEPQGVWNGKSFGTPAGKDFQFDAEDEEYGWSLLADIGVYPDKPLITFHNKDQAYWRTIRKRAKPKDSYRDSSVSNLLTALAGLDSISYSLLRSGFVDVAEQAGDGKIVSYQTLMQFNNKERAFLDFFIQHKCRFAICGNSGIAQIPIFFGKPVLLHNFIPVGESPIAENSIVIPKLLRWRDSQEIIPLRALFEISDLHIEYDRGKIYFRRPTADAFQSAHLYKRHNIMVEENNPEQILAGLKEVETLAAGKLALSDSDWDLQRQFQDCFPIRHPMRHTANLYISPAFLRQNAEQLLS